MSHGIQTKQCEQCANFQAKPEPRSLKPHSTGTLVAAVGLVFSDLAMILKARGIPEAEAPLMVGQRYLVEIGRRADAKASKGSEVQSRGETPVRANLDSEAGGGLPPGSYITPIFPCDNCNAPEGGVR